MEWRVAGSSCGLFASSPGSRPCLRPYASGRLREATAAYRRSQEEAEWVLMAGTRGV
jgi:hypothetical protein